MRQTVILPEINIRYNFTLPQNDLILIAGGRTPDPEWLVETARITDDRSIWCIDRGLDACFAAGLEPALLIGDGDSANSQNWKIAESRGIPIKKFNPEKDFTDTQLALQQASSADESNYAILTGCFGGRMDHLFSNIFSFAHSPLTGCMTDHLESVFFLKDGQAAQIAMGCRPKAISILPITDCSGVTLTGVYWPLHNADLTQRNVYTISNELIDSNGPVTHTFDVKVKKGILAVYICWSEN